MMRSPPPPTSQQPQSAGYGNPYQPAPAQGGSGTYAPGFGGFINDPTAQMGFHMGKTAMAAGQEYMEQNVKVLPKQCYVCELIDFRLTVQPLCLHPGSETLLQRLQLLCDQ
jgi:hypothetical protein